VSSPSFDEIAGVVRDYGRPYPGGLSLRHTGSRPQVACRECGPLVPPQLAGWTEDWLSLCQEARDHALDKGHEVAVSLWNGAIYGPRQLYWERHAANCSKAASRVLQAAR